MSNTFWGEGFLELYKRVRERIETDCVLTFQGMEDWAPGVVAGCEGYKPEIVEIDLKNKIIKLKFQMIIEDGR